MTQVKGKIGVWTATSLVTGNMIGSGIFLLPAALAAYGGISLWGWIFSATGSLALAYVFASLARYVRGSGGPYIYSRAAFGNLTGFLVAWGYWICIIAANAAIAIALVSYLSVFFPALAQQGLLTALVTLGFLWFLAGVNLLGIKSAARLQLIATIIKLIPLIAIAFVGVFYIKASNFVPWNLSDESTFSAISSTAALTMWAFLGMESANNVGAEVDNPEKTIPRAALAGTIAAAVVYILGSTAVLGIMSAESLRDSAAPFADAAAILWGPVGFYVFACCAIVSCFGTLNGWTLCVGQIPKAVAEDGLFPKIFARQSKFGVPAFGIILSTLMVSVLVMMNHNARLVEQFTLVILLSTLTTVLPYLMCSIGHLYMSRTQRVSGMPLTSMTNSIVTVIAALFAGWIIANIGLKTILLGMILLVAGLPVFWWTQRHQV